MKLLLTCGGTAGHVYPAVALARVFQRHYQDCQVLFVGADGGMELKLVAQEGASTPGPSWASPMTGPWCCPFGGPWVRR